MTDKESRLRRLAAKYDYPIKDCYDCGAKVGELHIKGCLDEECPFCGRQLVTCYCDIDYGRRTINKNRIPWSGCSNIVTSCFELGYMIKYESKDGKIDWMADANRVIKKCIWNSDLKTWLTPMMQDFYVESHPSPS